MKSDERVISDVIRWFLGWYHSYIFVTSFGTTAGNPTEMRHLATFKTDESMYGTQEKYGMCWQKKKGAAIDFSTKNKFILSTEN